jgi:hypothetical protein
LSGLALIFAVNYLTNQMHDYWALSTPPRNTFAPGPDATLIALNQVVHQLVFGAGGPTCDLWGAMVDPATAQGIRPQNLPSKSTDGTHADLDLAATSAVLLAQKALTMQTMMTPTEAAWVTAASGGAKTISIGKTGVC